MTFQIWFLLDVLYCELKASGLGGTLPYPREKNSRSFARLFQALVMWERYYLSLASILWFKVIVVIAGCLEPFVESMERNFSDLKAL